MESERNEMTEMTRPSGKARQARRLLLLLALLLMMLLLPSFALYTYAEVLTLPMDETGGVPPHPWGYTDDGYEDPSIRVQLEFGREGDTNWTAVRIRLANASQLRTLKAAPYGSTREVQGAALARRVKSVLAIGGDFFIFHNHGYIVRQGQFYRNRPSGEQDVLIIDREGNLDVLIRPEKADIEAYEARRRDDIANAFTFGPALVMGGERVKELTELKGDPGRAQRIALCQTGELEYLVVYSEGPSDKDSAGLSVPQFADLVASFPGVRTAYNLDGGSSATIVFKGEKINGPKSQRGRSIGDIIYFASAWAAD